MNNEDFDMLYWHAVNTMRLGSFKTASQYFRYCYNERKDFFTGLGLSYCLLRHGDTASAKDALKELDRLINTHRQRRLYERLERRLATHALNS